MTNINQIQSGTLASAAKVKGAEELCPFVGRTLTSSPCGMPSVLDRAFKGEL